MKKILKTSPLWIWVGVRMSMLAVGANVLIVYCMYMYYLVVQYKIMKAMPSEARQSYMDLSKNPDENSAMLWRLLEQYYPLREFAPGLEDNSDWWALFGFVALVIPIAVALGFILSRPLSKQFSRFASVAKEIASGKLDARVELEKDQPMEIQRFAGDFNFMGERLHQYEREVRESSAILAHELRTPLNAALGRVQGMLDNVFPIGEQQLKLVESQLLSLNALVSDLHFLSLAQSGTLNLKISNFELTGLINERLTWFMPQLQNAKMKVIFLHNGESLVRADSSRVGQMVNILIENAIRYASEGGELEIEVIDTGEKVLLQFKDRGKSVKDSELKGMFGRFWRAEQSRARVSGGSGLGLSIAEAIVHAHNGSVWASNRRNGGLKVHVSLPSGA